MLSGHDHDYERFAPQTGAGKLDAMRGILEFVVGTGGRSQYPFTRTPLANSIVRADVYGVLKLTLLPTSYRWQFLASDGSAFTDRGSARCR